MLETFLSPNAYRRTSWSAAAQCAGMRTAKPLHPSSCVTAAIGDTRVVCHGRTPAEPRLDRPLEGIAADRHPAITPKLPQPRRIAREC